MQVDSKNLLENKKLKFQILVSGVKNWENV